MYRGLRSGGGRGACPEWTEGERTKARHACGCRSEESLYCEGAEIARRIGGDGLPRRPVPPKREARSRKLAQRRDERKREGTRASAPHPAPPRRRQRPPCLTASADG